jgi:hypothetical protein
MLNCFYSLLKKFKFFSKKDSENVFENQTITIMYNNTLTDD